MNTEIRLLRSAEEGMPLLDAIAAMDAEVFGESRWGREGFLQSLSLEYDDLIAALCGEKLVGYGLLRSFDDAEIVMIAADPKLRRRGIGQKILNCLKDCAVSRGVSGIFLEVRESNLPAVSMYEKAGFIRQGLRRNYYHAPTEDALVMRFLC